MRRRAAAGWRPSPAGRVVGTAFVLLVVAVCLSPVSGCTEVADTGTPVSGACVVQGRMNRWPGAAGEAVMRFRAVGGSGLFLSTSVDAYGRFRAELPPGRYVAEAIADYHSFYLTPAGDLTSRADLADTLSLIIGQPARELAYRFGAMRFTATGLQGVEDWDVSVSAENVDHGDLYGQDGAEIRDGAVTVTVWPLVPGDYRARGWVRRASSQDGDGFWLPGVATRDEAAIYHVDADSLVQVALPLAASPARLVGRVIGAWLELGRSPPLLVAVDLDSNRVAGPWRVWPDGSFDLTILRPQPVRLAVVEDSRRHWVGGPRFAESTVFDLEAGDLVTGLEVAVSGLLVRATFAGVEAIPARGWFELLDQDTEEVALGFELNLESSAGQACLLPGRYLARLKPPVTASRRWRGQWYDRATDAASATIVTVPEDGGVLVLDFVLEAGATVTGSVDFAGATDTYATVLLARADDGTVVAGTYVPSHTPGFSLGGLEPGSYKLGLVEDLIWFNTEFPAPATAVWHPAASAWPDAVTVAVAGTDSIAGFVLQLP